MGGFAEASVSPQRVCTGRLTNAKARRQCARQFSRCFPCSPRRLLRGLHTLAPLPYEQGALQQFHVDMTKLGAFRYRVEDALRAVTRVAVKAARLKERAQERAELLVHAAEEGDVDELRKLLDEPRAHRALADDVERERERQEAGLRPPQRRRQRQLPPRPQHRTTYFVYCDLSVQPLQLLQVGPTSRRLHAGPI